MRPLTLLLLLTLALCACAPAALEADTQAAQEVEQAATLAWHRMEAHFLETGAYSTAALRGLTMPRGTMWNLQGLADTSYELRFGSSKVAGVVWTVTPGGVRRGRA
ncbi:hypothetical protein BH24DEI1_BH24DEI1_06600 [soil metagenome]|jgi:hypothetical protein|nr:hypothetical protein [Deinococcota bacterium]